MAELPAICADLRLRPDGDVPVVNSRDVAELFEKEHRHILADIDRLRGSAKISAYPWFREASSINEQNGQEYRSFDLTRQGFTLLVMGWTGVKALKFKTLYIQAFDEMEAALKQRLGGAEMAQLIVAGLKEAIAPLAVRFDGQDQAIERIEKRQDALADDVASIKFKLLNSRRHLSVATKREHVDATRLLGGRCPCCGEAVVIDKSTASRFAQFDHFYANSQPNAEHTWLICSPCHSKLSGGHVPRDQREAEFRAYQNKRRRLPGRQIALF